MIMCVCIYIYIYMSDPLAVMRAANGSWRRPGSAPSYMDQRCGNALQIIFKLTKL